QNRHARSNAKSGNFPIDSQEQSSAYTSAVFYCNILKKIQSIKYSIDDKNARNKGQKTHLKEEHFTPLQRRGENFAQTHKDGRILLQPCQQWCRIKPGFALFTGEC
ncbi:MAG TPA: hypothetical protein VHD63_14495, partial [Ktedonobacteraceae bacterium]|nr:hypothetical protein [Ktedonobacteraceae bacterium]